MSRNSFKKIALFMDSVNPPNTLKGLLSLHRFSKDEQANSFKAIWNRHNHPSSKSQKFLFYNTYLMDVAEPAPDASRKPFVRERAIKIGQYIRGRIDIAALCEVWEDGAKEHILEQL